MGKIKDIVLGKSCNMGRNGSYNHAFVRAEISIARTARWDSAFSRIWQILTHSS